MKIRKYLDNKGFAVSVILYTSIILVFIIMLTLVSVLSAGNRNRTLISDAIKEDVSGVSDKEIASVLGFVNITASDSIGSGAWHKDPFTLDVVISKTSGVTINFPITYYYGTSSDDIKNQIDDGKIKITEDTASTIYYVRGCRTGSTDICTEVGMYEVKLDKSAPSLDADGESTTWSASRTLNLKVQSISDVDYYEYYVTDWEEEPNEIEYQTFDTNKFTFTDTGKFVYVRVTNKSGRTSSWEKFDIYVDSVVPDMPVITSNDGKISGEWHKSVTLSVDGSTSLSGIDYYYSTTSTNPENLTTAISQTSGVYSVSFTKELNATFAVMACNKAKVCSDIQKYVVRIDPSTPTTPTISGGSTTWSIEPRVFTITSKSTSISDVAYYEYYISLNTTTPSATQEGTKRFLGNEVSISTSGRYIFFREVNNAGTASSWSGYKNLYVDLDTIASPTIIASDNKVSGEWHTADVKLSFSNENVMVPLTYYYGTTETNLSSTGTSKTHNTNTTSTTYYVKACKTSNKNDCSPIVNYEVKLDKTIPSIKVTGASTTWANSKTLVLTPTSTSGISYYEYAVSDTTPTDDTKNIVKIYENSFTVNETGKYIYIRAINKVGLSSAWAKFNLYVDNSIPNSPILTANDKLESGSWHAADTTLTINGSTSISGINYYYSTTSTDPYDSSFVKASKSSSGVWTVKHTTNTEGINYYVTACNNAPNKVCSSVTTYLMKLDENALNVVNITGGNTTWTTTGVDFTITSTNTPFSGFSHYEYYLSTSQTKPANTVNGVRFTDNTITISSPGKYVYFREVNKAGRASGWTTYKNLFIDEINLPAPIITAGDGITSGEWHTTDTKLTFTNTVTSIPLTYYYGTSEGSLTTTGTSKTHSANTAGITYYVKVCRSDSNQSVCSPISSYYLKLDKTVPTVAVTGASTTWTSEKTLTLTSSPVSGLDYFEYYISDSTTKPSADITEGVVKTSDTSLNIKYPQTGKYIYIRATNKIGITGAWVGYLNLYVDSITPQVPIITAGDGITSGEWHKSATKLTFSGVTGTSTITYKYYNSENTTLKSGSSIASDKESLNVATSGRTYYVKACNSANLCSEEVSYVYKMDNSTPAAPNVTGGDTTWISVGREFVLTPPTSASGISHYEYYISTSSTTPGTSVVATGTFQEPEVVINTSGKYIYFRAINNLGTVGKWTGVKNLFVDNLEVSAPTITASDKILSDNWHTAAAKLTFSGSDTASPISYYYGTSQDNITTKATEILTTNNILKNNTVGVIIYVKACNGANVCSKISEYIYKLDNVAPAVPTITGGSDTWTTAGKEFTITSTTTATMVSGSKGFEYYVSKSATTPSTTVEATGIIDQVNTIIDTPGQYIYFREVTNAGKKSNWTTKKNLYIDYLEYSLPIITVSDSIKSGNWHTATNVKLTFSSDITTVPLDYYYYTSTNASLTKSTNVTNSGTKVDITYYIKLCRSGGTTVCSGEVSYNMKIDSVAPTIKMTGNSTTWASEKTLTLTPTSFSTIDYYDYYLTNTATAPVDGDENIKQLTSDTLVVNQSYKFIYVRIHDKAGKKTGWVKYDIYVDSLKPNRPLITTNDGIQSEKWHIADTTLTFTTDSTAISGIIYKYRTNTTDSYKTATSVKLTAYTAGTTYYVVACTNAGVCSDEVQYVLKLDKSTFAAPTVKITNDEWDAGPKMFTLSHTNSEIEEYEYYVSDSSVVPNYTDTPTGRFTNNMVSVSESGVYIFFRAVNNLGRSGSWSSANKLYINAALLSDLNIQNFDLQPLFSANTYLYNIEVPYDVAKIDINTDTFVDSTVVKITNNNDLKVGLNTIYIETDNNGITATYRIEVTRLEDDTNTLKSLTVSGYDLVPLFNEEINEYTVTVDDDVETVNISAIPVRDNETISGTGDKKVEIGENVFSVSVIAANGDVNNYVITIIKN